MKRGGASRHKAKLFLQRLDIAKRFVWFLGAIHMFSSQLESDDLEARIAQQAALLREDRSPDENRVTWLELTRLHAMRSPRRIQEMEIEAGLR